MYLKSHVIQAQSQKPIKRSVDIRVHEVHINSDTQIRIYSFTYLQTSMNTYTSCTQIYAFMMHYNKNLLNQMIRCFSDS